MDADGVFRFAKFPWKPVAGTCSLIWDEAQKLWWRDPDFNRREIWEDIENGDPLEWDQPVCPLANNQRDAMHRQTINKGQASYEPNSIDGGYPAETPPASN